MAFLTMQRFAIRGNGFRLFEPFSRSLDLPGLPAVAPAWLHKRSILGFEEDARACLVGSLRPCPPRLQEAPDPAGSAR